MPNGGYDTGGYGTIEEIDSFPRIIEWTIPDFFLLPKQIDHWVRSEEIRYYIFRCIFRAWPNGTANLPGMVKFEFHGIGKPGITRWKLELISTDGTILRKCGGWKRNGCEVQMDIYISIKEIQTEQFCDGILKVRVTLYCEETLENPDSDEEKNYAEASSQTESTLGTEKLSSDLEELLITGNDSNVTIRVEGEEFKAHKSILSARTAVFTSMFQHKMSESITNVVDIDDCDAISFREFLGYLYTGRVDKLSLSSVYNLHRVADKYHMDGLKACCLEYIKKNVSVETVCDAAILAVQYDEDELMDIAAKFLSQNMSEVKDTEKWENFLIEYSSISDKLIQEALELYKQKAILPRNMPAFLNRCMAVGTLEEIYPIPKIMEWTISDFFQLPKEDGYSIKSPIFTFKPHRCKFVAMLKSSESSPDILMFALEGIGKTGVIGWELEIRRADNTVLKKSGGLKNDGSEVEMNIFVSVDEIVEGCYRSGFLRLKCTLYSEHTLNYPEKEESYAVTSSQTELVSRTDRLSYEMVKLLIRGEDSDVTIRVENAEFKVHKFILEVRAPMFTSMIKDKMSESHTNIVNIDDCDDFTFLQFLFYIYSGRVKKLSLSSIFSLHQVADNYQVNELKAHCVEQLKNNLTIDTFCDVMKLSLQYDKEEDLVNLVKIFHSTNKTEIEKTEKWKIFTTEVCMEKTKQLFEVLKL